MTRERTIVSDSGTVVATSLTDDEAITRLRDVAAGNVPNTPNRSRSFAADLIAQWQRRGLSKNQIVWVHKLVIEAKQRASNQLPAPVANVSFAKLAAMFERAGKKLAYPQIRLRTQDGTNVFIRLAGPQSREPGSLAIVGDWTSDGRRIWYGRVSCNGDFHKSQRCPDDVQNLVVQLDQEPAKIAAQYGRLTGSCCFCGRELTDGRSTSVGYGPICADNFGLPWGI